jgi:hypothetical protein
MGEDVRRGIASSGSMLCASQKVAECKCHQDKWPPPAMATPCTLWSIIFVVMNYAKITKTELNVVHLGTSNSVNS